MIDETLLKNRDLFSSRWLFKAGSGVLEQSLTVLALLSVPSMKLLPVTKRSPPDQLVSPSEMKLLAGGQVVRAGQMETVILHPGSVQ